MELHLVLTRCLANFIGLKIHVRRCLNIGETMGQKQRSMLHNDSIDICTYLVQHFNFGPLVGDIG